MQYTISAVSPETKTYETKYGNMVSYRVKFEEMGETVVTLSQKDSTTAPKKGDTMDGTIDMSGQYGPKFKREFKPKSSFGGKSSPLDPHTMYVSYAKDIAVALISTMQTPTDDKFASEFNAALEIVNRGAKVLEAAKPEQHNETGF